MFFLFCFFIFIFRFNVDEQVNGEKNRWILDENLIDCVSIGKHFSDNNDVFRNEVIRQKVYFTENLMQTKTSCTRKKNMTIDTRTRNHPSWIDIKYRDILLRLWIDFCSINRITNKNSARVLIPIHIFQVVKLEPPLKT